MARATDAATQSVADIYDAFRYFTQILNARKSPLEQCQGVTAAQLRALQALQPGPLTMGELQERLYVQPSTMSGMVDRLEAAKLVERRRSAADRRRVEVVLTPLGQAMIAAAPQSVIQRVLDRLHDLPPDELAQLHQVVGHMHGMLREAVEEIYGTETPGEAIT